MPSVLRFMWGWYNISFLADSGWVISVVMADSAVRWVGFELCVVLRVSGGF